MTGNYNGKTNIYYLCIIIVTVKMQYSDFSGKLSPTYRTICFSTQPRKVKLNSIITKKLREYDRSAC